MAALDRFANDVDVVTYEFENVPAETATFLSARKPVLPDPKVLATTQDRLIEKEFVQGLGIGTASFAAVDSPEGLTAALDRIGQPAVLKTRRFGYDGKGQTMIRDGGDPVALFNDLGGQPQILEAFVPFEREISVVAARVRARPDRKLRRDREHASGPHPEDLARAGRRHARGRHGSPAHRRDHRAKPSAMSACWRWKCSWCGTAPPTRCWSTRSRRACTIPATGPSTAPRCRSSSSTSARSRAGRWQSRSAAAASR